MGGEFTFSVTTYTGHEDEILQVRNRNRRNKRDRKYLDWRYLGEPTDTPPMVFWMRDADGEVAAMASLIFRPYCVDNQRRCIGVLGDISVSEEHRGIGLSSKLFQYMNNHIEKSLSIAFVMPNKAAERALDATGWITVGNLVPRVCILQPFDKLESLFRVTALAKLASMGLRALTRFAVSRNLCKEFSIESVENFGDDFQNFWEQLPKDRFMMHDRSRASLTWRYLQHPNTRFWIRKFHREGRFVGYAVFTKLEGTGMCLIADFVVADPRYVRPCMALLIDEALQTPDIVTVRIVLIEHDRYSRELWKLSFFSRDPVTVFQLYHPVDQRMTSASSWFITPGDKDA